MGLDNTGIVRMYMYIQYILLYHCNAFQALCINMTQNVFTRKVYEGKHEWIPSATPYNILYAMCTQTVLSNGDIQCVHTRTISYHRVFGRVNFKTGAL